MEMVARHSKRNKKSLEIKLIQDDHQSNPNDRLSDLPEPILHHIFSLLNIRESCQAGSLSHQFHRLWSTNPVLDFDPSYFPYNSYQGFIDFVDSTMNRYSAQNIIIKKIKLEIHTGDHVYVSGKRIDKWVEIAFISHVEVFHLCISRYHGTYRGFGAFMLYKLPLYVLSAKSLKSLKLSNLEFPSDFNVSASISGVVVNLVCLEYLSLVNVHFEDDCLLRHIISSSPLNELEIHCCSGIISEINITESSNIRRLSLVQDGPTNSAIKRVNLESSNLDFFHYNGGHSFLSPLRIHSPSKFLCLRNMSLSSTPINGVMMNTVLPWLPLLEVLVLYECLFIHFSVLISSCSLKNLEIQFGSPLEKVEIDAPKLESFFFSESLDSVDSHPILSMSECAAHCKAHLSQTHYQDIDTRCFVKLREFLVQSNMFDVLILSLPTQEVVFNLEDILEMPSGAPYNLSRLELHSSTPEALECSISNLIDGLFWSCHPNILSVSVIRYLTIDPSMYKMIMKKLSSCAISWSHALNGIEVESIDWDHLYNKSNWRDCVDCGFKLYW